jgi:hypothetical protein
MDETTHLSRPSPARQQAAAGPKERGSEEEQRGGSEQRQTGIDQSVHNFDTAKLKFNYFYYEQEEGRGVVTNVTSLA